MILRELFYFDDSGSFSDDDQIDSSLPKHIDKTDTRKTKLTLRQINRIRKASDVHQREKKKDLVFVKKMYSKQAGMESEGGLV
jgi:hypothetical protein